MDSKVILVTGAFGTLGRAILKVGAAQGCTMAAVDFSDAPGAPSGGAFVRGGVDLVDPAQAEAAVAAVLESLGRIDAVLNAVGGFVWQTTSDAEPAVWERMHTLNLTTVVNTCRAALPALIASEHGAIVNVGALGAVQAGAGMGPYAAAKAGVHKFTEALAEEMKIKRVTVNAVLPSIIDTPANRADMGGENAEKWVEPSRLAEIMLFLTTPAGREITGALIPVKGRA
jgi:NAD(P)-dependent dehydrogenase (short-subunit alcohol dehydrogenase family)